MTVYSNSDHILSQLQGSVVRATDSRFSGPEFKQHSRQFPVNCRIHGQVFNG